MATKRTHPEGRGLRLVHKTDTHIRLSGLTGMLLALRPKAMDFCYNKCGMYDKGQCDVYSNIVRELAKQIYGAGIDATTVQKRLDFQMKLLHPDHGKLGTGDTK